MVAVKDSSTSATGKGPKSPAQTRLEILIRTFFNGSHPASFHMTNIAQI